ncbi:hypothetical protein DFQ29_001228, partial [Apophysomyces sp. BC1021]
ANEIFRQFVWNNMSGMFKRGVLDDPINIIHAFTDAPPQQLANTKLSSEIRKYFTLGGIIMRECFHAIRTGPATHDSLEFDEYKSTSIFYLMNDLYEQHELYDGRATSIGQTITEDILCKPECVKKSNFCKGFNDRIGNLITTNTINEVPEFFFIRDPLVGDSERSI